MAPRDLRAGDSMAHARKNSEYLGCPHFFYFYKERNYFYNIGDDES